MRPRALGAALAITCVSAGVARADDTDLKLPPSQPRPTGAVRAVLQLGGVMVDGDPGGFVGFDFFARGTRHRRIGLDMGLRAELGHAGGGFAHDATVLFGPSSWWSLARVDVHALAGHDDSGAAAGAWFLGYELSARLGRIRWGVRGRVAQLHRAGAPDEQRVGVELETTRVPHERTYGLGLRWSRYEDVHAIGFYFIVGAAAHGAPIED